MIRSAYTRVFKKLYPMYNKAVGRDTFGVARERISTQSLPEAALREIQFLKLKRVLVNAAKHVPYYREKFASLGFDPERLSSLQEFEELDFFITKADVKANPSAFISEVCDRRLLTWHRTGGSTGEPLHFPTDPATNASSASAIVRALSWWGIELGEPHAMFWGSPQFIIRSRLDHARKLANIVRNKAMNRLFVSNYNLNKCNIRAYRKKIEAFQPVYVRGMPSSLYVFARGILEEGGALIKGAPKIVHSACEQLFDWQKETIEAGFNAKVVNTYGLSELADIAYGAPCGEMHVMDEDVLVELHDFGVGEREIVATQLNNMMSPLIRYRTGDMAESLIECHCALNLRVLKGIKGRAHDFIVAPDGRFLHGQLFTHLVVFEDGVRNYQIRQLEPAKIKVSLVIDDPYDRSSEVRLRQGIRKYMGGEVEVEFAYVDKIPLTPSGKHRWIISDVAASKVH